MDEGLQSIRYVEPEQFRVILDAVEDNDGRMRRRGLAFKPWFNLALRAYRATGARPAEIVGREARQRRGTDGTMRLHMQNHHGLRAMDLRGDFTTIIGGKNTAGGIRDGAGLKYRAVTVGDRAVYRELEELADGCESRGNILGLGIPGDGKWDGYSHLQYEVKRLRPLLPVGLRGFQIKWLRHSWAIYALRNGVDIYEVSRQLGHNDIETTQIYLRFAPRNQAAVLAAFTTEKQPAPVQRAHHDCPSCGFTWKTDAQGRLSLDDRIAVATRPRPRHLR